MNTKRRIGLFVLGLMFVPLTVLAALTDLNGQTGATQTFVDDSNVTITSSADVHTLGWTGLLAPDRGGSGVDMSGFLPGSILLFDGTSVSENGNLSWNDSNDQLVINGDIVFSDNNNFETRSLSIKPQTITNTDGNNLEFKAGDGNGTSSGGNIILRPGDATYPGKILIGLNSNNIPVLVTAEPQTSPNTQGLDLIFQGGVGNGEGNGGSFQVIGGGAGESGNGGDLFVDGGPSGWTENNLKGGTIWLTGGVGQTAVGGVGGDINLTPGWGTQTSGNIYIFDNDPTNPGGSLKLDTGLLSSDRILYFPDDTGTLSLLETDQEFTGINTFSNRVNYFVSNTDSTVYIGQDGIPGCIAMGDSDGVGVTYITANNGALSATTSKPGNCQ